MAEQGTLIGELERGWRRLLGLSWKWKVPALIILTFIVIGAIGAATDSGEDDTEPARADAADNRNDGDDPTPTTKAPTQTKAPTNTPTPTATATPTVTPTPTRPPEELQKVLTGFFADLNNVAPFDVGAVNLSRIGQDGWLELEYRTEWASRDLQPKVSYDIAQLVAAASKSWDSATTGYVFGTQAWGVRITTYSVDNNYRYQSATDLATLHKVAEKSLTYAEWVSAASAGFR